VILSGANTGLHPRGGEAAYAQYVRHLEKSSPAVQAAQKAGTVENFAQGYQDYLQAPLQVSARSRGVVGWLIFGGVATDGQSAKHHVSDV
jgi:hypothetical protein